MDLICGDYRNHMTTERRHIVAAVRQGLLPEAVLDRSLTPAVRGAHPARPVRSAGDGAFSADHAGATTTRRRIARCRCSMAQASMVLLKNQGGLLPLRSAPRTIAVIGPNADSLDALVGNYYGTPSQPVTVLDGIRARFPDSRGSSMSRAPAWSARPRRRCRTARSASTRPAGARASGPSISQGADSGGQPGRADRAQRPARMDRRPAELRRAGPAS